MSLLKKNLSYLSLFILLTTQIKAQEISPSMYGQNVWMPSFVHDGAFENVISNLASDGQRPFQLMRIGGNNFDKETLSYSQYENLINAVRSIDAEPLVQVPIGEDIAFSTALVAYLNDTLNLDIKYWSIGNEPDLGWVDSTIDGRQINSADDVAYYFTSRASAMKAIDPSIKIFGPDYSFLVDKVDNSGWSPMKKWHYPLLENNYSNIWGKDDNGHYYIDYYAFHVYQYADPTNVERKVATIIEKIKALNAQYRDDDTPLEWAITETHITTNNEKEEEHDKTWSFYAGQHIAQIFGIGMKYGAFTVCPWSIHESGGLREKAYANGAYDLGFFDAAPNYSPRSTYYHEFLLSQKAKWNYLIANTNYSTLSVVATYDNSGYAIMLMNDSVEGGNYTLQLNNKEVNNALTINIDADLNSSYLGTMGAYETQMIFLSPTGEYLGKITYNKTDATAKNTPLYEGQTPNRENSDRINDDDISLSVGHIPFSDKENWGDCSLNNSISNLTCITYSLHSPSTVKVSIYNVSGENIATFNEGAQSRGQHAILWDHSSHFPGVYLICLQNETSTKVLKCSIA